MLSFIFAAIRRRLGLLSSSDITAILWLYFGCNFLYVTTYPNGIELRAGILPYAPSSAVDE